MKKFATGAVASALMAALTLTATPACAQLVIENNVKNSCMIVVTARKVSDNFQGVPGAVVVVGVKEIENLALNDVADVSRAPPSLTFDDRFGSDSGRSIIQGQANIIKPGNRQAA